MKKLRLPLLVVLSFLSLPLHAVEIRTIYVAADPRARLEFMRVLQKEWPGLRLADRASEADAVLEIRIGMYRPQVPGTSQERTRIVVVRRTAPNGTSTSHLVTTREPGPRIEFGQETAPIGHAHGVLRLRGIDDEVILYSALPSPFFAAQFAREFAALRPWPDAGR